MPTSKPWTLVLDGTKYREGAVDEGVTLATHVTVAPGARGTPTLLGFSSVDLLRRWTAGVGLQDSFSEAYRKVQAAIRSANALSGPARETFAKTRGTQVTSETARVESMLRARGIKLDDKARILGLARSGEIGSALLYDGKKWGGPWRYLPPGAYPKFSWFGFNDVVESVGSLTVNWVLLCQHTWWRGVYYWIPPLNWIADLGWFNNRASSAVV